MSLNEEASWHQNDDVPMHRQTVHIVDSDIWNTETFRSPALNVIGNVCVVVTSHFAPLLYDYLYNVTCSLYWGWLKE